MEKKKPFELLNAINCNEHTEKKNGLTYLSWAWAWAEVKKAYPDANYTIYEDANGRPYHNDGRTCWVKTGVTIEGLEHVEYLPVMDYRNVSIPLDKVTSMDVNKAIQRSLTKACARHGLGLYIYAGEDLPESDADAEKEELADLIACVYDCVDVDDLTNIWKTNAAKWGKVAAFKEAVTHKGAELKGGAQ